MPATPEIRRGIVEVLQEAARRMASDVILSAGSPITYHIDSRLVPDDPARRLSAHESESLVYQVLTDSQKRRFETECELDLSFHVPELSRFRVSVYRQRGTVAGVFRLVPLRIPDLSEIGMEGRLMLRLLGITSGLILITGPTGAGKSTTVASLLEHLNNTSDRARHVITIEDPIEFLLQSRSCIIDQRELGPDTKSYVAGLRSALRQMPHIIFVGEMRDRATTEVALSAAETGTVVISTLATQSASKTINRIIDVFPVSDQAEIRARLALNLKAVVSQVLLRRRGGGGLVAAREILFVNNPVGNLIREGKIHQINNVIASSAGEGMILLDESLVQLYRAGAVDAIDVVPRLQDPDMVRQIGKAA